MAPAPWCLGQLQRPWRASGSAGAGARLREDRVWQRGQQGWEGAPGLTHIFPLGRVFVQKVHSSCAKQGTLPWLLEPQGSPAVAGTPRAYPGDWAVQTFFLSQIEWRVLSGALSPSAVDPGATGEGARGGSGPQPLKRHLYTLSRCLLGLRRTRGHWTAEVGHSLGTGWYGG